MERAGHAKMASSGEHSANTSAIQDAAAGSVVGQTACATKVALTGSGDQHVTRSVPISPKANAIVILESQINATRTRTIPLSQTVWDCAPHALPIAKTANATKMVLARSAATQDSMDLSATRHVLKGASVHAMLSQQRRTMEFVHYASEALLATTV
jgi:hypothetical protein